MNRPKFHKLYFPGLISLVFLPVMCICYFLSNNTFHRYQALRIRWINNDELRNWMKQSHPAPDILTFRKYDELSMTGNAVHGDSELSKLKSLVTQMTSKKDTINGISVSFNNNTRYAEIVEVIDFCNQNEDPSFGFISINNKVMIFYLAPAKYIEPLILDHLFMDHLSISGLVIAPPKKPLNIFEQIKYGYIKILKYLSEFWPSVLIFMLMICFAIFKKKRFLNLSNFHLVGN